MVGLIAPSRMITENQVATAIKTFQSWGLEVKQGKSLFSRKGYFAGSDAERLSDLQDMINNGKVRCIFCARGGYGVTRILDDLDLSALQQEPKWIIGFSDITALHLTLNRMGIESIHGLMPVQFDYVDAEASIEHQRKLLFEDTGSVEAQPFPLNRYGTVKARLVGGNLSLLADSLGTASEIDTKDRLLFLEEIDEYLYKVDRMLTQLKRAGKLDHLKGLILGDFSQIKDTQIPFGQPLEELILDKVREYDYPVGFQFPLGHEIPNYSVPLMREVGLTVDPQIVRVNF